MTFDRRMCVCFGGGGVFIEEGVLIRMSTLLPFSP